MTAVAKFVEDLRRGQFRKGLRIKQLTSTSDEWEMTWAADGRAVFTYGPPKREGHPHIVWLRVGSHDILAWMIHGGARAQSWQDVVGSARD